MRLEYFKLGGDTLNNKKAILVAMDKLDTYTQINREIAVLESKQKSGNENANEKNNGSKCKDIGQQKGNNGSKSREPSHCKTHEGQDDRRDCPNNPRSKKFNGNNDNSKGDKAKSDGAKKMTFKGTSIQEAHFI
jgi:hypothetical protein